MCADGYQGNHAEFPFLFVRLAEHLTLAGEHPPRIDAEVLGEVLQEGVGEFLLAGGDAGEVGAFVAQGLGHVAFELDSALAESHAQRLVEPLGYFVIFHI